MGFEAIFHINRFVFISCQFLRPLSRSFDLQNVLLDGYPVAEGKEWDGRSLPFVVVCKLFLSHLDLLLYIKMKVTSFIGEEGSFADAVNLGILGLDVTCNALLIRIE